MTKLAAHPTLYDVNQSPPTLIGSRCADCDAVFFPPLGIGCEVCGSTKLEAADLAASGTLHSVATVHLHANPKVETPFTVGEVSLDAGPLTRALLIEDLDAGAIGSQDVGKPTSSKRDKSEFELQFGLYFELPVQRRKGLGKIRSARAKIGQLDAKRRFTVDKIGAEVEMAVAAIDAASRRVAETSKAVNLAEELARIERRKFDLGQSDLLAVFLREQFAIEAANNLVSALGDYHISEAELAAAIGAAWPRQEPKEITEP